MNVSSQQARETAEPTTHESRSLTRALLKRLTPDHRPAEMTAW